MSEEAGVDCFQLSSFPTLVTPSSFSCCHYQLQIGKIQSFGTAALVVPLSSELFYFLKQEKAIALCPSVLGLVFFQ